MGLKIGVRAVFWHRSVVSYTVPSTGWERARVRVFELIVTDLLQYSCFLKDSSTNIG
jgi:hypothetical protein